MIFFIILIVFNFFMRLVWFIYNFFIFYID
jgi:hypothetical protein